MELTINAKNVELTEALQATVKKKVAKLEKLLRPDTAVTVVLALDGYRQICEVTIPFAGVLIRGEESTPDMYASIDGVVEKIEKQIIRYRTRLERRWRNSQTPPQEEPFVSPEDTEEELDGPRIVRTKRFALKPMSLDEAALQLQLLGHDFYVFQNADTEEVNVLYKRRDGDLGLIEPTFDEEE